MYTILKQRTQSDPIIRAAKLQKRREDYIAGLLRLLSSEKALRKKVRLKKWQVDLLTLMYDFIKQKVTPGSVVACDAKDFIADVLKYAEQKPEVYELLKKHNLYNTYDDGDTEDYEKRLAIQETAYDTITDILNRFGKFSGLDDGISYCEDSIILYRDMLPERQDQDSQNDENQVEDKKAEEEILWLTNDFDWAINTFIENNTDGYTTVLSEDDFFNEFKKYVESTLLSEDAPDSICVAENRKTMLKKLVSSIEYFYSSLYKRTILNEIGGNLSWFMEEGYVVLINDDLTDYDQRYL